MCKISDSFRKYFIPVLKKAYYLSRNLILAFSLLSLILSVSTVEYLLPYMLPSLLAKSFLHLSQYLPVLMVAPHTSHAIPIGESSLNDNLSSLIHCSICLVLTSHFSDISLISALGLSSIKSVHPTYIII